VWGSGLILKGVVEQWRGKEKGQEERKAKIEDLFYIKERAPDFPAKTPSPNINYASESKV